MKEIVNIKDYLFFQEGPGVRNTQYTSSGVKLLNVANLIDGKLVLDNTTRYISEEEAYGKYKHFLVDEGDLIIASSGIKVEYFDKKMGFVSKEQLPLCMNTSTIRFKSLDSKKLNIKYFMYFLKSFNFKKQLFQKITGSAQLNFGPSHLKLMVFPLVDITFQNKIVEELDKINAAIENRYLTIQDYNNFIESTFNKMFGNPIINDRNWKMDNIGNVCEVITGTTPDTKEDKYWNGNVKWITPAEIKEDSFYISNTIRKITDLGFIKTGLKMMPIGTVIFSTRAPIGKTAIITEEMCCNQGFKNCICGKNVNNYYLYYLLKLKKDFFINLGTGATFKELSKKTFSNISISIPDITLQKEFGNILKEIENKKILLKNDINDLETILEIKMHEYFD